MLDRVCVPHERFDLFLELFHTFARDHTDSLALCAGFVCTCDAISNILMISISTE